MDLTPRQLKTLEKFKKVAASDTVSRGNLYIIDYLVELEEHVDAAVDEVKALYPDLMEAIEGMKGEKGEDADNDYLLEELTKRLPTPEKVDKDELVRAVLAKIRIPKDGNDGKVDYDLAVSEVMKRIPLPENGKDGSPDMAEDIRNKLELLVGEDRLDASAIRGLDLREQAVLDRAIEILDRRTQYLINKQSSSGGASTFTALTDVPNSYAGQGGKAVRVNAGQTGLEFFSAAGSGTVTSVASADGSVTVTNPTTTADLAVVKAPKLSTARTIDGVSFDGSANIAVIATATDAATSKTTPVDADELPLVDSAAAFVLKKLTWANLKATLKTYFDTLDAAGTVLSVSGTANRITSSGGTTPVIDISATFEALLGKVASGLGQFASTTSAQLATVISDETGSGALVFASTPTLVTPILGAATATTINGNAFTAGSYTLTGTAAKTLNFTNTLTLSGTDGTTMTFPTTSKTLAANDGSNLTIASQAIGDILTATSTTAYGRLAAVAVGQVLSSAGTGTAPAWSSAPQITTIELGAATDTTLSRSAAGVLAVEGVVIPSVSSTNTVTNKRNTRRTPAVTQSATPTINTDNTDVAHITGLAQAITSFTTNLTGTPVEGDLLRIDITDNGTARAITWGASFEASTVALPTTTVISTRLDVGFAWNTVTSKWRCIAVA